MKTIDEAARIHCNKSQFESDFKHDYNSEESGFKAGVEFAQRWIPVDEELPKDDEWVLTKSNSKDIVSVCCYIAKFNNWLCQSPTGWQTIHRDVQITHWRQIEIK